MFLLLTDQNLLKCIQYIQKRGFALKWVDYAKAIA